ncbi:hypothetical protein AVEN_79975-1 [Araneus ventricosus]|uniref:RNase H type-1 domain-containing protein n=1 Tax=Araneus ventricosus TaxID=182803 RepID=A0A4Y2QP40_ARAVE|nr:hypothetical protein AVEN_79975-1 [Araneus ventricosus]
MTINIYTEGSKIDYRTGGTFCVRENNISTAEWMSHQKPQNSVFQVELDAIKEACTWASQSNQPIKIWTDGESSLHSISSLKTNNPLAQGIQNILLISPNIELGWRMWYKRKTRHRISSKMKSPWKGSKHNIEHTGASSKRMLNLFLAISTQLWQNESDNCELPPHPSTGLVFHSSVTKTRNHIYNGTCPIPNLP